MTAAASDGSTWLDRLEAAARERDYAGLRRSLRPRGEGDTLIDLAGNDYLGLSRHPDVLAAAADAVKAYGLGATGSRLVRGSTDLHAMLESALAELLGTEAALVYSSGYLANLGAVRAVATTGMIVASDAHNHASLVDGCRLAASGPRGSRTVVFDHAGADALSSVEQFGVVVTESVFSVHGDLAPLPALHAVARSRGAVLVVDEAHAFGVLGPAGGGAARAAGLAGSPDIIVTATLSKALGAAGGIVAGPAAFVRHLIDTSRTFIYDTGLAPPVAAGAYSALTFATGPLGDVARAELFERSTHAAAVLGAAGLRVRPPAAGVLSVAAPGPRPAVDWAAACLSRGVAVGCFRPPSTPDGSSALRLTINAGVPRDEFDHALAIIVATAP